MRRNVWQLPYHPLQVVAIAVFLALGFAVHVFFISFVGKKLFEYVIIGLYTPLRIMFMIFDFAKTHWQPNWPPVIEIGHLLCPKGNSALNIK